MWLSADFLKETAGQRGDQDIIKSTQPRILYPARKP